MYKLKKQYRFYGYDYFSSGHYFVTMVTKDRLHYFGEILDNSIELSAIGKFGVENILKFTADRNADNPHQNNPYFIRGYSHIISIDNWVVMPNHIHLLIEIGKMKNEINTFPSTIQPLQVGSLGSFVNHFKGKIKRFANENDMEFQWQSRFHDRIIRDDKEYNSISNYIDMNIMNWGIDEENTNL